MAITKEISADQLTQELEWISTNGDQCPHITLNMDGFTENQGNTVLNDIIQYVQETLHSLDTMVPSISFQFKDPVGWPSCLNNISSDGSGCMIARGYAYPRDVDWTLRNVHSGQAFKVCTQSNVQETLVGQFSISTDCSSSSDNSSYDSYDSDE